MNEINNSTSKPQNLIGNSWVPAQSGRVLPVVSPIDGATFAEIPDSDAADVDLAIAAAREAFETGPWSKLTAVERGRLMLKLSLRILEEKEALAQIETKDNGKPIKQSRTDMIMAARYFEF